MPYKVQMVSRSLNLTSYIDSPKEAYLKARDWALDQEEDDLGVVSIETPEGIVFGSAHFRDLFQKAKSID